jgi:hypothetical protein
MNRNISERGLGISFLLISSLVSIYSPYLSIIMVLIGSFFLLRKFGMVEYWSVALMLLIRSQDPKVLQSEDLAAYVELYNSIANGIYSYYEILMNPYNEIFSKGEVVLPTLFWIFSRFISHINVQEMSFAFIFVYLVFLFPIVNRFKFFPIVAVSIIIFSDVVLVVHLFRQTLASLFILLSIIIYAKHNKIIYAFPLYIFSILIHTTSLLFGIISKVSVNISERKLKMLLLLGIILSTLVLEKDAFRNLIVMVSRITILDKAFHALDVFESEGGLRLIALISIGLSFFVTHPNPLFRVYLVFSSLGIIFYQVPIVAPRIGLIGTSILTGLPIGLFMYAVKTKIIKFINRVR